MRELSIEEKAERYDEAVKEAYIAYKDEDRHLKATLERVFPELTESDDEKIRKTLINVFTTHKDYEMFFGVSVKDIRAWLEKQGKHSIACSEEQMKVLDEVLTFAANHEDNYWNCYIFETLCGLIRQLKKLKV